MSDAPAPCFDPTCPCCTAWQLLTDQLDEKLSEAVRLKELAFDEYMALAVKHTPQP